MERIRCRGGGFIAIDVVPRAAAVRDGIAPTCPSLPRALPLVALTGEKFEEGSLGFCC